MPISEAFKIAPLRLGARVARLREPPRRSGIGNAIAVRFEQDVAKPVEEIVFVKNPPGSNPRCSKVFNVEMHHSRAEVANPGDNVVLNINGLTKINMPQSGDAMGMATSVCGLCPDPHPAYGEA